MIAPAFAPDLTSYDVILISTSGGKDSALTAWYVTELARGLGILDRVHAVHATFPEEWAGTTDLVRRQTQALGIPLDITKRGEGILDYATRRRMWPDSSSRWCTSEFKRGPISLIVTQLVAEARLRRTRNRHQPVRVLNVMGMRADESRSRAQLAPFRVNQRWTGKGQARIVHDWLPLHGLTTREVWQAIEHLGLEMHPAYQAGMPRLSCCFCIFAGPDALLRAGQLNPELLDRYVQVERAIGHTFKKGLPLASIQSRLAAGERAPRVVDWAM